MCSIATIVIKTHPIIIMRQRKALNKAKLAVNLRNHPKRDRKGLCLVRNILLKIMELQLI